MFNNVQLLCTARDAWKLSARRAAYSEYKEIAWHAGEPDCFSIRGHKRRMWMHLDALGTFDQCTPLPQGASVHVKNGFAIV